MLFVSFEFIVFIAALFAVYYICPKKLRWYVLLTASLAFYTVNSPKNIIYLAVTGLTSWALCLWLDRISEEGAQELKKIKDKEKKKARKEKIQRTKRIVMLISVLIDLAILAYTKYTAFVLSNINAFLDKPLTMSEIFVPLGISFYTFKTVSYVLDVYRGTSKAERILLSSCSS